MKASDLLLPLSLVIAVIALPFLSLLFLRLKQKPQTTNLLVELLKESNQVNRSLTHLVVSKDFQTYAGLQSLANPIQNLASRLNPSISTSTSDYIPRDDATEALRMQHFGAQVGYGEAIFDEDPELAQTISEMVQNGQVDFGEGGI